MLILHYVMGRAWAITPEIAEHAISLFDAGGIGALRQLAEIRSAVAGGAEPAHAREGVTPTRAGNIAIVPLMGLLTHRGGPVDGGGPCPILTRSTASFGDQVRAAALDSGVDAIVIEADSPGGEVNGVPEAAAMIREARKVKPVVASVNTVAGSGAYWLVSQADEIVTTVSGSVGSIGVYKVHEDMTAKAAAEGRKMTVVSAGKYKVERGPFQPLSEEAQASLQSEVNSAYDMFVTDVAKGRRVSKDAVRDGFGQGRMVGAKLAVTERMTDSVGTLQDAVRRAAQLAVERRQASSSVAQAQADRYRRERGA
jgi:signal peptide peptidase SppA